MCEPVTALTVASGTLSAFGGLASAKAQKESAARDWEYQMELRKLNFQRDQGRYALKLARYDEQIDENALAASSAFAKEQAWLNDQFNKATVEYQDAFVKVAENMKFTGTGRTGERLKSKQLAALGRMQALQVSNLTRARERVEEQGRDMRRQLQASNTRAFDEVGAIPTPGLAPPKPDMDMTGAYLNFAGSMLGTAASGAKAFSASKPPTEAFTDTGASDFLKMDSSFESPWDIKPITNFSDRAWDTSIYQLQ